MYSISWNSQSLTTYGVLVKSHALSLARTYDSMQCQDRAWAGKGQGAPCVMTLDIYITGANQAQCEDRYWDVRGLLDQEDECELKLDRFNDRYWMAKFDSLSPLTFVGKNVVSATLIFTCHDRAAYATSGSTQSETLTENISADYGGGIIFVDYDSDEECIYCGGATTNKVYKLDALTLTKLAESDSYGNLIECICHDADYVYIVGDTIGKAWKLDKNLTKIAEGPAYGGTHIYALAEYGNYIYYGGDGGAGQYDVCKLLKSDMTTIVRSADLGGIIFAIAVNSTHVFAGGDSDGAGHYYVKRYLVTDMSYVDASDDMVNLILSIAIDATNCYWCGSLQEVWYAPLANLSGETRSGSLGTQLSRLVVDDDYIYLCGADGYVYKMDIDFAASASYIARNADYGGPPLGIAIDTTNQWLYIGGDTAQVVKKLDTRHLPVDIESEDYGTEVYEIAQDDEYLYTIYGDSLKVIKVRRSDMVKVRESVAYASSPSTGISAIAVYGDYVYIGGDTPKTVWKLNKEDLTKVCESPAYDSINCIEVDASYVYAGDSGGVVHKLNIADLTWVADSSDYTTIRCMCSDATSLYAGGSLDCKVRKITKATMATAASSADLGTLFYDICCDTSYVYAVGWFTDNKVSQLNIADLSANAQSEDYGAQIYAITQDTLNLYIGGITTEEVWKIVKSTMVTDAKSDSYGGTIGTLAADDGFIYVGGATSQTIQKLDKRVLWQRSDHEITITSAGTAKCGLDFASTASQANYWQQAYENQTTGKEWDWEGTQENGEELEVDSELWYCTLEGASAMSGVTGEFLTLSPGANVLYLENVTGVVVFDWTDRFA